MAVLIECPGVVLTGALGEAVCTDGQGTVVQWVERDWSAVTLDPAEATAAFGAGFFIISLWWVGVLGLLVTLRFLRGRS